MSDSYSDVTHESWLSRLGSSIKSVFLGLLLFAVSFPWLWWNEGRALHTAQGLKEAGDVVASANAQQVDAANEQRLVHLTGAATTTDELQDGEFGIRAQAIKLNRRVEMFQWEEKEHSKKRKKLGGGTERVTTYEYEQKWINYPVVSAKFRQPEGHANPTAMRIESREQIAPNVTVGAFDLSADLVTQINQVEALPLETSHLESLPEELQTNAKLANGALLFPNSPNGPAPNPQQPAIGDLRVTFEIVRPGPVSLMARQKGKSFAPWEAKTGTIVNRLMVGEHTAVQMVQQMQRENTWLTWLMRGGGFLIMAFGIGMIFSPLTVLADVIPFVGDLLRLGTGAFAVAIASCLSLLTIATAWLAYRPLLAVGMMVAGVLVVVLVKRLGASRRVPSL